MYYREGVRGYINEVVLQKPNILESGSNNGIRRGMGLTGARRGGSNNTCNGSNNVLYYG